MQYRHGDGILDLRNHLKITKENQMLLEQVIPRWMHRITTAEKWSDLTSSQKIAGKDTDLNDDCGGLISSELERYQLPRMDWTFTEKEEEYQMWWTYTNGLQNMISIGWSIEKQEEDIDSRNKVEEEECIQLGDPPYQLNVSLMSTFSTMLNQLADVLRKHHPEIVEKNTKEYVEIKKHIEGMTV